MNRLLTRQGNTLILVMVVASLSLAGVVFVLQQVGLENSLSIKAMKNFEASGTDRLALGMLIEKFSLKSTSQTTDSLGQRIGEFLPSSQPVPPEQSPFFFVDPYPIPEELNDPSFKPSIASFRQATDALSLDPNIRRTNSSDPIPLPLRLVEAKTDNGSGRCTPLSDPEGVFKNENRPSDCLVTQFLLDATKLATLEKLPSDLSSWRRDNKNQRAFVVVPNLSNLSSELLTNYFNQNSATFPTSGLESKMVSFLKMVPKSPFSRVLDSLIVKVGGTIAEIRMPVPPEPAIELMLAQGQSEPVRLGGSTSVDVKTNSITVSGTLSETQYRTYRTLTLPRQSAKNINSVRFTTQTTERVVVPRDLYTNVRAYGVPRIDPSNDRFGLFRVMARVSGLRGATQQEGSLDIRVSPPPAPRCLLTFGPDRFRDGKELLQGEGFTIYINCKFPDSGHVDSATIGGIPVSNFKNIPGNPDYKTGSVYYTRRNTVNQETIDAEAKGPGGTWTGSESLNAVCVMNDSSAIANFNSYFGPWPFTRTAQIVSSWGWGGLYSTGESSVIHPTHLQNYYEACAGSSYCMGTYQFTYAIWDQGAWVSPQTSFGTPLTWEQRKQYVIYDARSGRYVAGWLGGRAVFAQIGDKRDASCSIQKYHVRDQGCFTAETLITMGDGSQKRVSQIKEKDLIFNPLYRVPTEVVKIVKGPERKPLYQVEVGKDKLRVTEDHPFLTQRGWIRADQLKIGEWLLGKEIPERVSSINKWSGRTPITVYNFELSSDVDEGHLVLANGIPTGALAIQLKLKSLKPQTP